MRVFRCVVASLLVFGLPAAALAAQQNNKLMQEVKAFGDLLEATLLEDDMETMFGFYADDVISLQNYGPRLDGIDAMREHHDEMTAAGMKITSFTSDPTEAWECGNQVIEIGTFAIGMKMSGMTETIRDTGKYMTVYVRDADGALKIKVETWNTDMNPMEMGAQGHE